MLALPVPWACGLYRARAGLPGAVTFFLFAVLGRAPRASDKHSPPEWHPSGDKALEDPRKLSSHPSVGSTALNGHPGAWLQNPALPLMPQVAWTSHCALLTLGSLTCVEQRGEGVHLAVQSRQ